MNIRTDSSSLMLLEQARQMIDASQFHDAEMVLDALVRADPENIEAWKTYLWVRQDQTGLDWVKDRALKTPELSEAGKRALLDYYAYLAEKSHSVVTDNTYADTVDFTARLDEIPSADSSLVRFELLDTFDYSTYAVRRDPRAKRRRAAYNFVTDITGNLIKDFSRHPLGKKTIRYAQQALSAISGLSGDSGQLYTRLIASPDFEKVSGFAALALVLWGIRLTLAGHGVGYVVLGIAGGAGRWWLHKFGAPGLNTFNQQVRSYLQAGEDKIPTAVGTCERKEKFK